MNNRQRERAINMLLLLLLRLSPSFLQQAQSAPTPTNSSDSLVSCHLLHRDFSHFTCALCCYCFWLQF